MIKMLKLVLKTVCIDRASGSFSVLKLSGLLLTLVVVLLIGLDGLAAIARNSPPVLIPQLSDYIKIIIGSAALIGSGLVIDGLHVAKSYFMKSEKA